jgi:hypothetical protein
MIQLLQAVTLSGTIAYTYITLSDLPRTKKYSCQFATFTVMLFSAFMIVDLQLVLADSPTIYTNKEICGDGIDNNVNGKIDDGCPDHPSIANTPHKIKTIYH